jgi:hypothetical protein
VSEYGPVAPDAQAPMMAEGVSPFEMEGMAPEVGGAPLLPYAEDMPANEPQDEMPGACPECKAPMDGNQCQQCGYSHETPVPPENLAAPSMSAKVGIQLGKVLMHICTQAIAASDPEALKGFGTAANDFASALQKASPPPSTVDPTQAEKLARDMESAELQAEQSEAQREHDAVEKEADHERTLEQREQDAEIQAEQQQMQAEQQAASPPSGQSS